MTMVNFLNLNILLPKVSNGDKVGQSMPKEIDNTRRSQSDEHIFVQTI